MWGRVTRLLRRPPGNYARRAGKPLPPAILADARTRLAPTVDPLRDALEQMARQVQALGFAPSGDVSGIVDGSLLSEVAAR